MYVTIIISHFVCFCKRNLAGRKTPLDMILKMVYDSIINQTVKDEETDMNRDELYSVAEDATRESELRASEVPSIDLYVDQILNLVSDKQKAGSERFLDRQLTKTMINNYSKDGLIAPIKGKKYTKEQIIQILTVYTLKNTLSIGEIKRLLQGAYAMDGFGSEEMIALYDRYMEIKEQNRSYSRQVLDGLLEKNALDVSDETDFLLTVGGLLSLSAFLRQTAQAMIDLRYPEPEESAEKDEKEEKKSEKKEKKEEKKEKKKKEKEAKEMAEGGANEA